MRTKLDIIDPRKFLLFVRYPTRRDAVRSEGKWANLDKAERDDYLKQAHIYQTEISTMNMRELEYEVEYSFFLDEEHFAQFDWEISEYGNINRFQFWSANSYWTKEETIFLILHKEPELYKLEEIKCFRSGAVFAKKCLEIETLIDRSVEIGELEYPLTPNIIISWCRKRKIEIPKELGNLVDEIYGEDKSADKKRPTDVDLGVRERESLLKLLIGMAVKGYSYDPKAARSQTSKEISDDLDLLGLSLSDDTIRKYLKEAADLLPPQE